MFIIDQFVANLRNEGINPGKYHLDAFLALPLLVIGYIVSTLLPQGEISCGKEEVSLFLVVILFVIPSTFSWAYQAFLKWNFLTLTNYTVLKPVDKEKVMSLLGLKPTDYILYKESNVFWNWYNTTKINLNVFWNMLILLPLEAKSLIKKREFLNPFWVMLLSLVLLFWIVSYINIYKSVIITLAYIIFLLQSMLEISNAKLASFILITSIADMVAQADDEEKAQADEAQADEAQAAE